MEVGKELGVEADGVLDGVLVGEASIGVLLEEDSETGISVEALGREGILERVERCVLRGRALVDFLSNLVQTCLDALFRLLCDLLLLMFAVDQLLCVGQTPLMRELRRDVGGVQSRDHGLRLRLLESSLAQLGLVNLD